ncbi:hypothetical protein N658DRAFT_561767 [Parathielavia hyrcaniae]|uniref:SRR1-like domain-containing protein n=1 Tax=Parathielavia hyrcaniae TaxID=113614 RepID=A0AAN6PTE8_9PEZI|nr:hypothetical protein N658DRAFT_561767 [Parathielavia hyrcaniae]
MTVGRLRLKYEPGDNTEYVLGTFGALLTKDGIKQWEASPQCTQLRALFDTVTLPTSNPTKRLKSAPSPSMPLVLTLRDIIQTRQQQDDVERQHTEQRPEIRCFAQNPLYDDADGEILGRAGITVVQDPRALLEVNKQSVVLSFSPNVPVRQIITDLARPDILIWDEVSGKAGNAERCTDPESPRLWTMIENHYN